MFTTQIKLPKHVAHHVSTARKYGHEPVSQGCAMFRCTNCDIQDFLDVSTHKMRAECAKPAATHRRYP